MKVSVLMITYNHAPFIAQAMDSALTQDVPFPIELVVADDCSTDGTGEIVREYAARFPRVIRPVLNEQNLGMQRNFHRVWRACRGQYIALLDGDDYWTCPDKLRAQAALLDARPDCALSFHPATWSHDDPNADFEFPARSGLSLDLPTLAGQNFITTCSVMYRAGVVRDPPPWLGDLALIDWPLHVLHAARGGIAMWDRNCAVYRVGKQGVWASASREHQLVSSLEAQECFARELDLEREMRVPRSTLLDEAFRVALAMGEGSRARRYLWRSLQLHALGGPHTLYGRLAQIWRACGGRPSRRSTGPRP
jgi:glycosyltransferase involved in cell wall biosynthesis